jgi:TP901 family phage tail tape measure protein
MANRQSKIAIILSAIDKASEVIDKASKKAKKAFDLGTKSAVVGAALAAPLILATNKAVAFEDSMADVAKVYNTKIGDTVFLQLGEQAKDLSEYLSKSAEESASLMASLGQGGVDQSDLQKVAQTAGKMAVAFDLTADIAGDRYTKLKNALGASWDETAKLGDAINYLSDNQASKASEILEFMAAGGAGVARASKSAGQDLAAMGSYLLSVGKSGAESATIMDRFYKGIMKNDNARKLFMDAGEGAQGFIAVLSKGAAIKDPTERFKYFQKFGEYGSDIAAMAGNLTQFKSSIASVADETQYLGSVTTEFENRNSTSRGKLNKAMAALNRVIIDFGANGIPILLEAINAFMPLVKTVGEFMRNNQGLTKVLFGMIAVLATLSFIVSITSFTFGGAIKMFGLFGGSGVRLMAMLSKLRFAFFALRFQLVYTVWPAILSATTAVWGFTAALLANPVTWIVVGVMALAAAVVWCYKNFDKLKAGFAGVMAVAKLITQVFIGMGKAIIGAMTFNPKMVMEGVTQSGAAIHSIMNGGIKKSFNAAYDASIKTSNASRAVDKAAPAAPRASAPSTSTKTSNVFSPTINVNGSATKKDGQMISQNVVKAMKDHEANKARLAY